MSTQDIVGINWRLVHMHLCELTFNWDFSTRLQFSPIYKLE